MRLLLQKPKTLVRKRNGANSSRLPRTQAHKALNPTSNGTGPAPKSPPRTFLLETPVQFTTVSVLVDSSLRFRRRL